MADNVLPRQGRVVQRSWFGRLIGLKPKVYVCRSRETGELHIDHQWPMWVPASTLSVHCLNGYGTEQRTRGRYGPSD